MTSELCISGRRRFITSEMAANGSIMMMILGLVHGLVNIAYALTMDRLLIELRLDG